LALDAPPPIIIVSTPITAGFAADPREMRSNSQLLAVRDALSLHGVNQFLVDDRLEVRQPRTEKGRQMPLASTDDRLPVVAILLVWLAAALAMAMLYWPRLDESFASPDNLMRLVQVRALLDGAPWFDPHERRLAPPLGYDTHWSRLIDAGIAGLIVLFRQLAAPDLAERLARCIWPLLLSGPAVFAVTAIAVRLGGPGAGRAALMAALPTLALLPTFRPGEIDHHNAQVTLSLITFAFAVWGDRAYFAAAAGIAAGALLGVGLEAAYVPMFVAAGFGLLFVHDPAWASPARHFGGALALSTLAFYFVLTPTALRFAPACDALAVNSALAIAVGAGGLFIIAALGVSWSSRARLLALAGAGALALGTFIACQPRCLGGPFALVDRSIFPLWVDRVSEMQSLGMLFQAEGLQAVAYVGFPLIATLAVLLVACNGPQSPLAWPLIVAFALAESIMFGQIRIFVYVTWLGLPFVGVAAQRLAARSARPALAQMLVAVIASPAIITLAIGALAYQAAEAANRDRAGDENLSCFVPSSFPALAALPAGLVIAAIDLGPAVLAYTPHSVIAAPYHRADRAIRFNQEIMDGPIAMAKEPVEARGVNYVVLCSGFQRKLSPGGLEEGLLAGTAVSWLESIANDKDKAEPLRIWRVKR